MTKSTFGSGSKPPRLLYLKGWVDENSYQAFLKKEGTNPHESVFIFPSNVSHHTKHTLYSKKAGGGLAIPAGEFGELNWPVLGLPTMPPVSAELRKAAVADLWRALGFGMNIVIPVRPHDPTTGYFEAPLKIKSAANLEPNFWGDNAGTPDTKTSRYYIEQLGLLEAFVTGQPVSVDADFVEAYKQGQAARLEPTAWYQKPGAMAAKKEKKIIDPMVDEPKEKLTSTSIVEVAPDSKPKPKFDRPGTALQDEKFADIKTSLEKAGWSVTAVDKKDSKTPSRTVAKGKQSFQIYENKITTSDNQIDTFRTMLVTFKKMHGDKAIPKINTFPEAKNDWEAAFREIYPTIALEGVISTSKAVTDEPAPEPAKKPTMP